MRQPRDQSEEKHDTGNNIERLGVVQELTGQLLTEVVFISGAGHDHTGSGGDNQCRYLGHQPLADGQQGIILQGGLKGQPLLPDPDDQSAEDIDQHDQDAGHRIPPYELAGTVHGAVELGLGRDLGAPRPRLGLADQPGVEVGVDGHLLAGHGIQGEAGRHLGDAAGALGHHHQLDDDQDDEDDGADHEVAADYELAEALDN